jgi:cation diffusion facilitator CzcD-associated flavoprotein CzcO
VDEMTGASVDVAVIGAGPYGLSIAAHLGARGIDYRVFGEPMQMWQQHMPPGMMLKSDGKSSDLSHPDGALRLAEYCRQHGIAHHASQIPVALDTFVAYGRAFQQRFVPRVERRRLVRLARARGRFELHFDDGEWLTANQVIVAVGVLAFRHVPPMFAALPAELASHSSAFGPLDPLAGRDVIIVGGGSSALDLAALAQRRGSRVTLLARAPKVVFYDRPPLTRSLYWRLRAPDSKIGAGWLLRICDDAPQLIHALPAALRLHIAANTLGPSAGYFVREHVLGKVALALGRTIHAAGARGGKVELATEDGEGRRETLAGDHLILATGYKLDVAKFGFLAPELLAGLRTLGGAPALSANFESSVPGLYFAGFAALPSFGPVVRFVAGAPHPARRLAWHLAARPRPRFSTATVKAAG